MKSGQYIQIHGNLQLAKALLVQTKCSALVNLNWLAS